MSLLARDRDRLADAAAQLADDGAVVETASADVADPRQTARAIDGCVATQGPADVLVTSAGMVHPGRFVELDDDVFRRTMEVNYFGTLHAIRAVAPSMADRGRGSIVGISSAAGLFGVYGYTAYAASKFAVRGLLESLRQELRPHGVHVVCVFPADVDTDQLREENRLKPPETKAISGTVSPIEPQRVADAIVAAIMRGRSHVTTDLATAALDRLIGVARGVVYSMVDRKVDQTRSDSKG